MWLGVVAGFSGTTVAALPRHAIAANAVDALPDTNLESVLSLATNDSTKPLSQADIFGDPQNVALAENSTDLKRQERFFFEAADTFHRLALKFKDETPNDYLPKAREYWLRYVKWVHDNSTGADQQKVFKESGARDRIQTAIQSYVALTADLVGPLELARTIETGEIDYSDFNDIVVQRWSDTVTGCIAGSIKGCSCDDAKISYLSNIESWYVVFPLKPARKTYFLSIEQKIQKASCEAKPA